MKNRFIPVFSSVDDARKKISDIGLDQTAQPLSLWEMIFNPEEDHVSVKVHEGQSDNGYVDLNRDICIIKLSDYSEDELLVINNNFNVAPAEVTSIVDDEEDGSGDDIEDLLSSLEKDINEEKTINDLTRQKNVMDMIESAREDAPIIVDSYTSLAGKLFPPGCATSTILFRTSDINFSDTGEALISNPSSGSPDFSVPLTRFNLKVNEEGELRIEVNPEGRYILSNSMWCLYSLISFSPGIVVSIGYENITPDDKKTPPVVVAWEVHHDHMQGMTADKAMSYSVDMVASLVSDLAKNIDMCQEDDISDEILEGLRENMESTSEILEELEDDGQSVQSYSIESSDIDLISGAYNYDEDNNIVANVSAIIEQIISGDVVVNQEYTEYDNEDPEEEAESDPFTEYLKKEGYLDDEDDENP